MEGRKLPQSLDSERVVCAGVVSSGGRALAEVGDLCAPEDFAFPAHEVVLQGALELDAAGKPVDYLTLQAHLKARELMPKLRAAGGPDFLHSLSRHLVSPEHLAHHARQVRALAIQRRIILAGAAITEAGYRHQGDLMELLAETQRLLTDAGGAVGKKQSRTMKALMHSAVRRLSARFESRGQIIGLPTGFEEIDGMLSGLVSGRLYVIAARPGMGKTAFVMQVAVNCRAPVYLFSLEMSDDDMADRALIQEGRIDGQRFAHAALADHEWVRINPAAARLSDSPIEVDDSGGVTMAELRAKLRRWRARNPGEGLVIVDYLQLLTGSRDRRQSREEEVAQFSRGLKELSKELKVPIIALAQLNRDLEKRADKRPMASDLRESGAIEQDADVILFLYRDEKYDKDSPDKGTAEVIVNKNRFGPPGTARLRFDDYCMRFS